MSDALICPICGEATRVYMGKARKDRLCGKHADMLKAGELILGDDGKYTFKGEAKPKAEPKVKTAADASDLTCIICGEPSNRKHFCYNCWNLNKKKTIYLKIIDCQTTVPLDAEYEGHLETKDGHIVKSHVERDIDNYLFSKNIPHAYESTYDVDGNPDHEFKPDFYLPNYLGEDKDVYIEYFGMKGTKDGDKKINYKIPIYKRDNVTLICLYPQDDSKIETVLKRKLNKEHIKIGELNWYEE